MPYSAQHKEKSRAAIIEAARILFNRHGFDGVTIDMIMEHAGLTRGGFYNHFKTKRSLYAEAVSSFLMGRGAHWRDEAGIDLSNLKPGTARQMLQSYLSSDHLGDLDGQCPMIALPSDIGRAGEEVQESYQKLLEAMVGLFERSLGNNSREDRQNALSMAALSIGGMIIARTLPKSNLAEEVRHAAYHKAVGLIS